MARFSQGDWLAGTALSDSTLGAYFLPSTMLADATGIAAGTAANPLYVAAATSPGTNQVVGNVAHDAVDAGNPIKTGGYASSTAPAAVSNGDRVNSWLSPNGADVVSLADMSGNPVLCPTVSSDDISVATRALNVQAFNVVFDTPNANWDRMPGNGSGVVTQPYAITSSRWQYAGVTGGLTDTSDAVLAAAAGASLRNYVAAIQYQNTSAVESEIVVKDGSTVIWRGVAPATMTAPASVTFPVPLKGTANTAMNVAMITTATATRVSAQGFTGV